MAEGCTPAAQDLHRCDSPEESRREKIQSVYILTVEKGKKAEDDDFYASSERARARGWPVLQLEANHVPQWYVPEATAALIEAQLK